ncbi:MAG: hybrid sensor histidine kinase/response regulator, partial [Alphaproteobacteria bacterium]|nr:hybrid sensor histidine kinase/response regulator [Alphaproteobacteria bacterium]
MFDARSGSGPGGRIMEELLQEFLAETSDNLEQVGAQIVRFESDPSDLERIGGIFRLVHTIKGTCGFLDLPRLEKIAHAAESLIGTVRDRAQASSCDVELILLAIDQIRQILAVIETQGAEPEGEDLALIAALLAAAGEDAGKGKNESASPAPQSGAFAAGAAHAIAGAPQNAKAHADVTNSAAAQDAGAMDDASRGAKTLHKESATIRVAVNTLERIMRLVSELVLTRNQLLELARNDARGNLSAPLQRLSGITSDLQRGIMHARMQPVERLFSSLPRMIRDLAANLSKKVELQIDGADTELDRQLIELIRDPITHLVRNCLDHGIETPEERMRMGKPEAGLLRVHAAHEVGHVLI